MSRFIAAIALGCLFFSTVPANADPIVVTGGSLDFDDGDPPGFRLLLSASPFSLAGVVFEGPTEGGGILGLPANSAIGCLFVRAGCFSGDVLSLGATIVGRGVGRVGPDADPENPHSLPATATFQFTTPDVPLVASTDFLTLQAPFEFSGTFRLFSDLSFSDIVFETTLVGRGVATAALVRVFDPNPLGPYLWEESVYRFAPTPEPATCGLVAAGLFAAGLAQRRRQRRGREEHLELSR